MEILEAKDIAARSFGYFHFMDVIQSDISDLEYDKIINKAIRIHSEQKAIEAHNTAIVGAVKVVTSWESLDSEDRDYLKGLILALKIYDKERIKGGIVRFNMPSDKQMFDVALLFNNGKFDLDKLSDMIACSQFIVDRLFENGDVLTPSSKEK